MRGDKFGGGDVSSIVILGCVPLPSFVSFASAWLCCGLIHNLVGAFGGTLTSIIFITFHKNTRFNEEGVECRKKRNDNVWNYCLGLTVWI